MSRISPQCGCAFRLKKGDRLKVICIEGKQVADLFCFADDETKAPLSAGRSIDYAETVRFTKGHNLYSFDGRPMLAIREDSCGVHDFLVTPCSLQMFQMMAKNSEYHPSCQENLEIGLAGLGADVSGIGTTFNIFMNVPIHPNGKISVQPPTAITGDFILLEALMPLLVGLTACSDEGSNGGTCKPIAYEILQHKN